MIVGPSMYKHAPQNYLCPFCLLAAGQESPAIASQQSDVIYKDEQITAFICARQWINNKGHVLIIPRRHFENIYDLPDSLAGEIHTLARRIAIAMKEAYQCDGVSTRQHNEPHGNQEVWHYHLHIFPRYENDHLYETSQAIAMSAQERSGYANLLRLALSQAYPANGWHHYKITSQIQP